MLSEKLNFGCGSELLDGYLNIDVKIPDNAHEKFSGKTILGYEAWEMNLVSPQQLPKNHFIEIRAHMVLEHIHYALIPNLLYCFASAAKHNCILNIVVPNFERMAIDLVKLKERDFDLGHLQTIQEITNEFLFPNMNNQPGHMSIWTPAIAKYWLNAEGWDIASIHELATLYHLEIKAVYKGGPHVSPIVNSNLK